MPVETAKKGATDIQHCFEIRTANVDYYVGEDAKGMYVFFLFEEKKPKPHINENLWSLKFGDIPASHCQKRIM